MLFKTKLTGFLIMALGLANIAIAQESHRVEARGMKFDPMVIQIAPGDTIQWSNMSTHNVDSLEGMIPEGAEQFKSQISQDYTRTFEEEGVYIYVCTPHVSQGMGGAIVVGDPKNLDAVKAVDVGGGKQRIAEQAIKEIESMM